MCLSVSARVFVVDIEVLPVQHFVCVCEEGRGDVAQTSVPPAVQEDAIGIQNGLAEIRNIFSAEEVDGNYFEIVGIGVEGGPGECLVPCLPLGRNQSIFRNVGFYQWGQQMGSR